METVKPHLTFEDNRGKIHGVINTGTWGEMNYIESFAGTVRGNHFHKTTTELIFILEGKVEVTITTEGNTPSVQMLTSGEIVVISPGETHVFHCLENTKWINLLSEPFNPQHPDIHTR